MDNEPSQRKKMIVDFEPSYLEAIPDPIILLDNDRKIIFSNDAASNIFNVQIHSDLVNTIRDPVLLRSVDEVLAKRISAEAILTLFDPVKLTYQIRVIPVSLATNSADMRVLLLFNDISSEIVVEKIRQDFVENVSHELRSPISSLIGFIETIQGPAKDDAESQKKFLSIMMSEAQRMSRMVEDLLSLSRLEAIERMRPDETADLTNLISTTSELFARQAQNRSMNIKLDMDVNLPSIQGDADELLQVFNNLVDNAIKYGREKTNILIKVRVIDRIPDIGGTGGTGDTGISIVVENEGDGINPDEIPRLTERFYRTDKGRSRELGGTGLGLAIVKHIINRHRGRLVINSNLNDKTTFTVFLPLK